MISSNMTKVKHSFTLKSKRCLLPIDKANAYPQKMGKPLDETEEYQLELAGRIKEIFASQARGFKKDLADKCGISPQALGGWTRTGKVSKQNLATLAKLAGYDLHWLITGEGIKFKHTPSIYDLIDAESHMTTQQKSSFKALFNSVAEQDKPYGNGNGKH